jgi:hypothetical protein
VCFLDGFQVGEHLPDNAVVLGVLCDTDHQECGEAGPDGRGVDTRNAFLDGTQLAQPLEASHGVFRCAADLRGDGREVRRHLLSEAVQQPSVDFVETGSTRGVHDDGPSRSVNSRRTHPRFRRRRPDAAGLAAPILIRWPMVGSVASQTCTTPLAAASPEGMRWP